MVVATSLALLCALLAAASSNDPSLGPLLEYRRHAIAAGSLYRLATAHLVHLSTAHALLDIAGLLLVAWIFAAESTAGQLAVVSCVAVVAIDVGLWCLHPEVERYVGLSGVLHAWFAAGAVSWSLTDRRSTVFVARRVWGATLLAALVVKLLLEQRGHAFWLDADPMPVVTSAHRFGAAAGVLCAALFAVFRRRDSAATVAS